MLAYSVARRTREIGIRLAIGANPGAVRLMVLKEVGLLALIGAVIGAPAAVRPGEIRGTSALWVEELRSAGSGRGDGSDDCGGAWGRAIFRRGWR